jgi:leucyl-tRNA synthetase
MAQRGFMGKISRWFSGPSDTYFFGLQIAIKCFGEDTLRARFARVLEESRLADENVQEKRRFLKRFVALLEESELFWSYGYWDYLDDPHEAAQEFQTWVDEIEGSMATEEEELAEEIDEVIRTSNRKDYVVATLLFLLDEPFSPADQVENEDDAYLKETFVSLVQGLTSIDPRHIQADGAYVVPGNEEDGVSEDDLYGPGWEHLRMLL